MLSYARYEIILGLQAGASRAHETDETYMLKNMKRPLRRPRHRSDDNIKTGSTIF
jgi:hypothetical protein